MVSVGCKLVLVIDFDGVGFLLLVCLYFFAKTNRNCGLKNFFYLEAFACLIVVY